MHGLRGVHHLIPLRRLQTRGQASRPAPLHPLHLPDRLTDLLGDNTARIRPELAPLADSVLAMDNPLSGLAWLRTREARTDSPEHLFAGSAAGT